MSMYVLRTFLMLLVLTLILMGIGLFFAGFLGMTIGLGLAIILNVAMYWFSSNIVLRMYGAKPLKNAKINHMVEKLAKKAGIPTPKTYIVDMDAPNAFATGRNHSNSVVAVTQKLIDELSDDEIEGVLAHEISHIKHYDMAINTIAATMGAAITWIAYIFVFGRSDDDGGNILGLIFLFILAPIAATLIRLAISRNREYFADQGGALLSNPLHLASALNKISKSGKVSGKKSGPTSHMFIVNPFSGKAMLSLFSTHPPTEERIARLKEMTNK